MSVLRRSLLVAPALLAAPGAARAVELVGQLTQGSLVVGHTAPGARAKLDGRALRVSPDGIFGFGFGRDAAETAVLQLRPPQAAAETRRLRVARRQYLEQRITGLPPAQVTPPPSTLERIRREQAMLNAARAHDTPGAKFAAGFIWPAEGRISGVYGSRRILNGEPRAPHLGLDIAAPAGAPVGAAAAGIVRLAEPDLYFTGGSVLVDHGHMVMSFYIHLSRLLVRDGEAVAGGQPVGLVGMTGRATGPHLHFALFWAGTALDPALVLPPRPGA